MRDTWTLGIIASVPAERAMKTRRLGRSGLLVSELCLGTMTFGNPRLGVDEAESRRVLDAYLAAGGNFLDTADAYAGGASEEILGRALDGRRDAVVLATKGYFPVTPDFGDPPAHRNALGSSRSHLTEALHASLRRLRTDHVDLYQVHCWDPVTPLDETLSTLDAFVRQGKVRYVGLSNYAAWQVIEAHHAAERKGWATFVTAQIQYSLICREVEQDLVPACRRHGLGILPWSPLGQGVLSGKYRSRGAQEDARFGGEPANERAEAWRGMFLNERTGRIVDTVAAVGEELDATPATVSLAWLLGRPGVSSVILGAKTVSQLEQNLAAASLALPPEALARLDAVSAPPPRYPEWFLAGAPRQAQLDGLGGAID